ncbi:MAG: divalent-cation tolerance protein CutA [Planctomycetota bacterium]
MSEDKIVVFSTASSIDEAEKITQALLEARKVACVNIVPEILSRYWWQNKICRDNEVLLIAKTKRGYLKDVINIVKENHSYETPEIIALNIVDGSPEYLNWLSNEIKF